jgi:glycine/D-amino acid oxidase-like deaminating enzyme
MMDSQAYEGAAQNGGPGVWFATLHDPVVPRPSLTEDVDCDVAVIGAGYTGLWTAYYLKKADPALRVVVLEREVAGFGASGRNGGWCHPYLPVSLETLSEESDRERAVATQNAMFDAVDEVGRVAAAEGIEQAHFHKGGLLTVATGPEQVDRVREDAEYFQSWGFGDAVSWLEPADVDRQLRISGCCGATFTSRSAVVQPAGLARGLADAVEQLGVPIYEKTLVTGFGPGLVATRGGSVRATHIVRATEGYSVGFSGYRRKYIPIYSLMIATEPLPDAFWDEVGWAGRETLTDGRHLYIYAARTPDGRIAIGGRGAPYHFKSRISGGFEDVPEVFEKLHRVLKAFFPAVGEAAVTHRWGGPLAIPRDWHPSIGLDAATGIAWAGGYVGDGVATTNLAGRTLTDLLLGRQSELVRLPLVGHRNPEWEPEPLRWMGVHTSMALLSRADRGEARTGKPSGMARVVKKVLGV